MDKSPDAFRTISEVAEWLGVQAHVLRFWESKFTQVKPVKRAGGRRYYRPTDMLLLGGIKKLLHDDGLTVKGVQKILNSEGVEHVSDLSPELCDVAKDSVAQMAAKTRSAPESQPGITPASVPNIVPFTSTQTDLTSAEDSKQEPPVDAISDDTPNAPDPVSESVLVSMAQGDVDPVPEDKPDVVAPLNSAEAEAKAEPEQAAAPAPEPEADQISDQIITPPPDAPVASPDSPAVTEKTILPSFLHRPAPESAPEAAPVPDTESSPEPEMASATAAPKILVVDAPDPPNEDEIPYSQGPLGHLATLNTLSAAQIAEIAPLAEELKAWLSRSAGTATP